MQEFLSTKICIKLSIPYLSCISGFGFVGVSPLMETKSISFSNLQVEPKHILAVAPGCRCCPPSLQFLQQLCLCRDSRDVLALTWDVWVLHSVSLVLLKWSLVIPQPCWVCAISSSRLQMPSLSVLTTLHRPYENASKQQLLRAVKHLQPQGFAHSSCKRFFLFVFPFKLLCRCFSMDLPTLA